MRIVDHNEYKRSNTWVFIAIVSPKRYHICNNRENYRWKGFFERSESNSFIDYNWFISQMARL